MASFHVSESGERESSWRVPEASCPCGSEALRTLGAVTENSSLKDLSSGRRQKMFITSLIQIVNNWKQPKCLIIELVDQLLYFQNTVEYKAAINVYRNDS